MHFVASSFSLGGVTFLFGGDAQVVHALGRQANFTGRTEIWAAVIPTVPNSIIGAGFESFWIAPNVEMMWRTLSDSGWWNPEELDQAHSGYIEIYLNLGWVGVCLIVLLLISGYRRAVRTFQRYLEVGSLLLAYIATSAIYSVTEAGFRELKPSWISLLLALVAASGVVTGNLRGDESGGPPLSRDNMRSTVAARSPSRIGMSHRTTKGG